MVFAYKYACLRAKAMLLMQASCLQGDLCPYSHAAIKPRVPCLRSLKPINIYHIPLQTGITTRPEDGPKPVYTPGLIREGTCTRLL